MNTIRKGNYYENLALKYYKRHNHDILFKAKHVRFHKNDFAGLFDIVAYDTILNTYVFVSVKSYRPSKAHLEELKQFYAKYRNPFVVVNCFYVEDNIFYIVDVKDYTNTTKIFKERGEFGW